MLENNLSSNIPGEKIINTRTMNITGFNHLTIDYFLKANYLIYLNNVTGNN